MKILNGYQNFLKENAQAAQIQLSQDVIIQNKVNKIIDYTVIRPGTTKDKVKECIDEAIANGFYSVVVNPELVDYAAYEIEDQDLKVISTLDFPDGKMRDVEKLNEAIKIISDGADEIDMVIDIEEFKKVYTQEDVDLKKASYITIEDNIKEISNECHKSGVLLKVVIETGILSLEELKDISAILASGNVDFVQTSTGLKEVGAELAKVKELRRLLPDYIKIKAAGGIRSLEDANMFYPFVDRLGTSSLLK